MNISNKKDTNNVFVTENTSLKNINFNKEVETVQSQDPRANEVSTFYDIINHRESKCFCYCASNAAVAIVFGSLALYLYPSEGKLPLDLLCLIVSVVTANNFWQRVAMGK